MLFFMNTNDHYHQVYIDIRDPENVNHFALLDRNNYSMYYLHKYNTFINVCDFIAY